MKWKCPTVVKQANINQLRNLSLVFRGHGVTGFAAFEAVQEGERRQAQLAKALPTVAHLFLFLYLLFMCLCNNDLLCFLGYRFINARRRIVQPMIDQSNRAGKSPLVTVFKSGKRKPSSSHSPGGLLPGK